LTTSAFANELININKARNNFIIKKTPTSGV